MSPNPTVALVFGRYSSAMKVRRRVRAGRTSVSTDRRYSARMDAVEVVDRADGGQRQHVRLQAAEVQLTLPLEHVVGHALGLAQPRPVDPRKRREFLFGSLPLGGIISVRREIAEPVGIAHVAAVQGRQRVALEVRFVTGGEQGRERLRWGLGCCRGLGSHKDRGRHAGQRQGGR
jgi:hypothetical protein